MRTIFYRLAITTGIIGSLAILPGRANGTPGQQTFRSVVDLVTMAVAVAALTVYDMAKAIDKDMVVAEIGLVEKIKMPV